MSRAVDRSERRPRVLDHDGAGADALDPGQGQDHRRARRADRSRRGAHLGMEGMFRQIGIYSSMGQLYTPGRRSAPLLQGGQEGADLEEGINEAGSMLQLDRRGHRVLEPWRKHGAVLSLLPMFGFSADRRFLLGRGRLARGVSSSAGRPGARRSRAKACSTRTVTATRGLDDSELRRLRSGYAYELAVIVQAGLKRIVPGSGTRFYYITCMNENYAPRRCRRRRGRDPARDVSAHIASRVASA